MYTPCILFDKGNNKITEFRAILQRESQNSQVYKQTKSVDTRKTVKTVIMMRVQLGTILMTCTQIF